MKPSCDRNPETAGTGKSSECGRWDVGGAGPPRAASAEDAAGARPPEPGSNLR